MLEYSRHSLILTLVSAASLAGCIREEFRDAGPRATPLFKFLLDYPLRLLEAGSYHGTSLYFEVNMEEDELPYRDWFKKQDEDAPGARLQLPPIVPEIGQGREVYRVGNVHRLELFTGRWDTGSFRYTARHQCRLYLFKPRRGELRFFFRGQEIVIHTNRVWRPSIYYYFEEEDVDRADAEAGGNVRRGSDRRWKQIVREVVQVGFTTIERPANGRWVVNGRGFRPEPGRTLRIRARVRADLPSDSEG